MILVDSSVWIQHFKKTDSFLVNSLKEDRVVVHPLIIQEISLGHIKNRELIIELVSYLHIAPTASHQQIQEFILKNKLAGSGVGVIDIHLLYAAVRGKLSIYTFDKSLNKLSKKFGCSF